MARRKDDEIIEAEAVDDRPQQSIEKLDRSPLSGAVADGMTSLAQMPDDEFEQKLAAMKAGQTRIRRIKRELMEVDVHYGTIPNTDKPALLKPGAEVLCQIFGLRATFEHEIEYGDQVTEPAVRVVSRCDLHLGDTSGPIVGTGYGAANTWERKHRYRRADRTCPSCGMVGAVIKGKAEFGGGWLCWSRKGGCGAKFKDNDQAITGQYLGDVENPDQHDLQNTIVKMSEKRAYIDATLRTTASSDLFTQDEPSNGNEPPEQTGKGDKPAPPPEPVQQPQAKGAPAEAPASKPGGDLDVEELHECAQFFTESPGITEPQQRRLFAIARGNGWDDAGVEDTINEELGIGVEEIPKLGDGYAAVVQWFQTHAP